MRIEKLTALAVAVLIWAAATAIVTGGEPIRRAAATSAPAATQPQSVSEWMMSYYRHPSPEQFEDRVKELSDQNLLVSENATTPMTCFFSRLMAANPDRLATWMEAVGKLKPEEQTLFVQALHDADTDACRKRLQAVIDGGGAAAETARDLKDRPVVHYDQLKPADMSPSQLDGCWGSFFATGDSAYTDAVFRCAAVPKRSGEVNLTRETARWSTKSLAKQDDKIAAALQMFSDKAADDQKRELQALLPPAAATRPANR